MTPTNDRAPEVTGAAGQTSMIQRHETARETPTPQGQNVAFATEFARAGSSPPSPGIESPFALWQPITAARCLEVRPPIVQIVDDLIAETSVGMVTGLSGTLKTMLLMDLGICVATGRQFLRRESPDDSGRTFRVPKAVPVLWYNADTPTRIVEDRFGALLRGHDGDGAAPLTIYSFPEPLLDFSESKSVDGFAAIVTRDGAKIVFIDNLQVVKGRADENSASEMGPVVANLRRVAERCGVAIVLIHHHGKNDKTRGSSAIRDLVDYSLTVERRGADDRITIRPDKCRNARLPTFGAEFWFVQRHGTKDLEVARFRAWRSESEEDTDDRILEILRARGPLNVRELNAASQAEGISKGKAEAARDALTHRGAVVVSHGANRSKVYSLAPEAASDALR